MRVSSSVPLNADAQPFVPHQSPDIFALDADLLGLTEADYAALELVDAEIEERIDLPDEEDIFNWGSWG